MSGLKDSIRVDVQVSRPSSLLEAIGLARLYESKTGDFWKGHMQEPRRSYVPSTNTLPLPLPTLARARLPVVKRLNPKELWDLRRKVLCFNCDERFTPGHKCK